MIITVETSTKSKDYTDNQFLPLSQSSMYFNVKDYSDKFLNHIVEQYLTHFKKFAHIERIFTTQDFLLVDYDEHMGIIPWVCYDIDVSRNTNEKNICIAKITTSEVDPDIFEEERSQQQYRDEPVDVACGLISKIDYTYNLLEFEKDGYKPTESPERRSKLIIPF